MILFGNAEYVSIGAKQDILMVEVINPTFFSSANSGITLPSGYEIVINLPRMLKNGEL